MDVSPATYWSYAAEVLAFTTLDALRKLSFPHITQMGQSVYVSFYPSSAVWNSQLTPVALVRAVTQYSGPASAFSCTASHK